MLTSYLTQVQRLLQNPAAPTSLYSTSDLTTYINLARGQLAGENECLRVYASLSTVAAQQIYPFSAINTSSVAGVEGVFNVKQITVNVAAGAQFLHNRSFQWFNLFQISQAAPESTIPDVWAQYSQGINGSIYLYPIPDTIYTLNLDTVCLPIPLVDDTTVEAIPYPWTDCVPFFAAFYAYLSAQRRADADKMYQTYGQFAQRARGMSNSAVLRKNYPQAPDELATNRLGMPAPRGGQ